MSTLERVTVNLTPRSSAALALAAELTQDSKTDTINRALQVYAYLMHTVKENGKIMTEQDGEVYVIKLL
jgi:hypothetical protein